MILKEILEKMVVEQSRVLLSNTKGDWEANTLLATLSPLMLKRRVHMQPGLYIAEISETGYLGQVLYKLKQKP